MLIEIESKLLFDRLSMRKLKLWAASGSTSLFKFFLFHLRCRVHQVQCELGECICQICLSALVWFDCKIQDLGNAVDVMSLMQALI